MAQKIGLALRPLHLRAMHRHRAGARAPFVPQPLDLSCLAVQAGEGIEQAAVRRRIHERALVVLAMDLDQGRAQCLESLRAERLIIDESARAAIGELHAP